MKSIRRQKTKIEVSDVSELENSSPGRLSITKRLTFEQKQDKKRILHYFKHRMVKLIEKQLWKRFDLMENLNAQDLTEVVRTTDL